MCGNLAGCVLDGHQTLSAPTRGLSNWKRHAEGARSMFCSYRLCFRRRRPGARVAAPAPIFMGKAIRIDFPARTKSASGYWRFPRLRSKPMCTQRINLVSRWRKRSWIASFALIGALMPIKAANLAPCPEIANADNAECPSRGGPAERDGRAPSGSRRRRPSNTPPPCACRCGAASLCR